MADWSWGAPALQWGLGLAVMTLVMRWLAGTRLRAPVQTATGTVLKYPASILFLGLVCSGMFGTFTVLSYSSPTGGPLVAGLFLVFMLLGLYLLYAYVVDRYEVRPEGLWFRTLRRGEQLARWDAIERVRYGEVGKWFVLRLRDGTVLRLSALLVGLPSLASALLHSVNAGTIAEESLAVLQQTAAGEPPRVW